MPVIDLSWTQIQVGLYQELVVGRYITYSQLHSADGYCFYDLEDVYYDEDGNQIPEAEVPATMRRYMQYCSTPETTVEALNARFISVPIEEGYEIVNVPTQNEVM